MAVTIIAATASNNVARRSNVVLPFVPIAAIFIIVFSLCESSFCVRRHSRGGSEARHRQTYLFVGT